MLKITLAPWRDSAISHVKGLACYAAPAGAACTTHRPESFAPPVPRSQTARTPRVAAWQGCPLPPLRPQADESTRTTPVGLRERPARVPFVRAWLHASHARLRGALAWPGSLLLPPVHDAPAARQVHPVTQPSRMNDFSLICLTKKTSAVN